MGRRRRSAPMVFPTQPVNTLRVTCEVRADVAVLARLPEPQLRAVMDGLARVVAAAALLEPRGASPQEER